MCVGFDCGKVSISCLLVDLDKSPTLGYTQNIGFRKGIFLNSILPIKVTFRSFRVLNALTEEYGGKVCYYDRKLLIKNEKENIPIMSHNHNLWGSSDTGETEDGTQLNGLHSNEQGQNGEDETNGRRFGQMLADPAVLSDLNGSPGDLWLLSE